MSAPPPSARRIRPGSSSSNRRATLWSIPAASIAGAIALQLITRPIDIWLTERGRSLPTLLDRGGAEDLRAVLSTIAGASITVLGLVLSITMVTVTLAATQLGPRLVRGFLTSRVTKATIGIFIGLFVYSILTLDSISTNDPSRPALLPELGTTIALLGSLAAILCLVWYVHSVARSIQVSYVVEVVVRNLDDTIDALRDERRVAGARAADAPSTGDGTRPADPIGGAELLVGRSGYVQRIEHGPLTAAAAAADVTIELLVRPGDFVVDGAPVVRVQPAAAVDQVRDACEHYLDVGPNRTLDQDVEFALDQLVEIALRALSPAINDTFTALTCVDWISEALLRIAAELDDHVVHADAGGVVRLIERPRPFPRIVKSAYEKVRQAGASNPAVAVRLLQSIGRVGTGCPEPERRAALRAQADLTLETARAAIPLAADRDDVVARHAAVVAQLS